MMKQIFPSANEKRELQEQARADMELQALMTSWSMRRHCNSTCSSRNTWKLTIGLL